MCSRIILAIAILVSLLWPVVDIAYHGHFSDARYQAKIEKFIKQDHIYQFEDGDIKVKVQGRWVTLEGYTKNDQTKREIGDLISRIPGIHGITNNLNGYLNYPMLEKLKKHLDTDPQVLKFEYSVGNDNSVLLTGRVATDELKNEIGEMVKKIYGVRKVINNLEAGPGKEKIEEQIVNILRLQNIYFDFNSARIRPESYPSIDKIANIFKEYPDIKVSIDGHTDSIGSVPYNQKLSEARAASVKNALVERGINPARLGSKGFGKSKPVADNKTPEGRAENRRIEFKVQ
jgi:outer membrane protein OmpA-like peptidoglycan-associated protein